MSTSTRQDGPENCVREDPPKTWEEARDQLVSAASGGGPVYFRGQSRAEWRLESRFGRLLKVLAEQYNWSRGEVENKREELQRNLLEQFRDALAWIPGAPGFSKDQDVEENEFVALAQHYGLPTPLLDWTRSPYIAAFLAFDGDKTTVFHSHQKVAIWVLDARALETLLSNAHKAPLDVLRRERRPRLDIVQIRGNANRRMVYQEGLFTRAFMVEDDIENYLQSRSRYAPRTVLTKIVLPGGEQEKVLRDLSLMAITPVALMNDADGAAATAFNRVIRFGLH